MIEVGEYVRFRKGKIDKVTHVEDDTHKYWFENTSGRLTTISIVKHSKNTIDLIEEGDYVNGKYVYSIGTAIGNLPIINHTDGTFTPSNLIESIVTKEQFAQMEYKVRKSI